MASHQTFVFDETVILRMVVVGDESTKNVIPADDGVTRIHEGMTPRLCVMFVPDVLTALKPKAMREIDPTASSSLARPRLPVRQLSMSLNSDASGAGAPRAHRALNRG